MQIDWRTTAKVAVQYIFANGILIGEKKKAKKKKTKKKKKKASLQDRAKSLALGPTYLYFDMHRMHTA